MSKTKKLLSGILSTAFALSACSPKEEIAVQEELTFSEDEINDYVYTDEEVVVENEVDLDHLQSNYPDMDLQAIEVYMEENNLEYNEEELIAFLDDLYENGEPTLTSNYYANENSFPWWIFLIANPLKTKPTGKITLTKPASPTPSTVNPTTKPSSNVTTSPSSSGTKSGSGFGTGSNSSGS
ncbi:hypothetical protein P8610_04970 [Fictibacillus sp. UD]|uniref:hypothetical protein n=1 Tax=Fictibacillus sp. UD TaxID=3038777 RepID=UPI003746C457